MPRRRPERLAVQRNEVIDSLHVVGVGERGVAKACIASMDLLTELADLGSQTVDLGLHGRELLGLVGATRPLGLEIGDGLVVEVAPDAAGSDSQCEPDQHDSCVVFVGGCH